MDELKDLFIIVKKYVKDKFMDIVYKKTKKHDKVDWL